MGFNIGVIIGAVMLMMIRSGTRSQSCTSFADLAEPCGCTLSLESFDPICGSDGNTYINECFMHCRKSTDRLAITMEYKGVCKKEATCTCRAEYKPVCGSNRVTYSNICVLNCHIAKNPSIWLSHDGECAEGGKCADGARCPDAGKCTDAVKCADHAHKRWRMLRSKIKERCICNPAIGPLCATNGVSYPNYCVMTCKAKALNDPSIKFAYWGKCHSGAAEEYGWAEEYNELEESGEAIIQELEQRVTQNDDRWICDCPVHTITYYTRCGESGRRYAQPQCACRPRNQPMKQNINNMCNDEQTTRPRPEKQEHKLTKEGRGSCVCAAVHKPVCATNHKTYANMCVLYCYAKKDSNLELQQFGNCGDTQFNKRTIQ